MTFTLTRENIVGYLVDCGLVDGLEQKLVKLDCCSSKNFNLVATFSDQKSFLVKQKRLNEDGSFRRDFYSEWRVCNLMQTFSDLTGLLSVTSEVLHYDSQNAILVLQFFPDYLDLGDFHDDLNLFPESIGVSVGQSLGEIHRRTYGQSHYCDFLIKQSSEVLSRTPKFLRRFDRIYPDVFGTYCLDGLEFFRVMQRSMELREAIAALKHQWQPSCLIHYDLKLDNLILYKNWEQHSQTKPQQPLLKIIDWELFTWGDPLYDVATLLGSYLIQWLDSLVVRPSVPLQQSLALATTPLEKIQPLLIALLRSYMQSFPALIEERSDFLERVLQFAGYYIFQRTVHHLSKHRPFDQKALCSLQIVKRLLCEPELSFSSIFGFPLNKMKAEMTLITT